ncbi:lysozyme c-1-like [Thrips palmi]|uniref:lysozyme n=1 Tax=Thrips palmi TaxID=161013 RepID=A0A6P8YRI0_THRPL|nr:lysozyme c-1-like [Thrips palmi]
MTAIAVSSRGVVGVLACCAALLLAAVDAKVYGRCDLAKALRSKGVPLQDIATWVCIGERLSSIDTSTATDPDDDVDGTVYHGVFLISDKWWCDKGSRGCGVTCEQMKRTLESNIDCAKKVFTETKRLKKNGFMAWETPYNDCQQPESYVQGCAGLEEDPNGEDLDLTVFQRSGLPKDA